MKHKQHFSHHHVLIPLQLDEGEKIECKACENAISEPFHGCLSCNYYMHDRCIDAPRFLDHPSHPSHPLTLLRGPTYTSGLFTCNACGLGGKAFSFCCAKCRVDIHVQCMCMPSSLLLLKNHPHELELMFSSPYCNDESVEFACDVCRGIVDRDRWLYYCRDCDYGAHLGCVDEKSLRKVVRDYRQYEKSKGFGEEKYEDDVKVGSEKDLENEMFEAEKKLREQTIAHRLILQSLDNAADYVGPSYGTKYYYY